MKRTLTFMLLILIISATGCGQTVSLPQNSFSQSVSPEEAPNVSDGWIYGNNCFDGSYSLCRFNLDGEVVKIHDDNPATIVVDKDRIYYSTMPDGEESLDIYRI